MKYLYSFAILIIFLFPFPKAIGNCLAVSSELDSKLSDEVQTQIDEMEFSELENLYEESKNSTLENLDFKELVTKLVNGEYVISFQNIFGSFGDFFKSGFSRILPLISIILVLALLSVFINNLQFSRNNSIKNIIFYLIFAGIVSIVISIAVVELSDVTKILGKIQKQVEVVAPILLSLIVAIGGANSVAIYEPSILMFAGTILEIFVVIITPIFIICFVSNILGNMTDSTRLTKLEELASSFFKTIIGFVFTIFVGFLSIQGITASTVDGVSIKTAKYAIKNYVPIIGGYLSEGFEIFRAGSVLIKNSIGVVAILLLFGSVFAEVISLVVVMLSFKLLSALTEPIAESKISKLLSGVAKSFQLLLITLLIVTFMYFFIILLMVSTANIF